ncbi:hypothetical protein G6F37_007279 [Rhizopus arrhizus]|nr:hypothetical protein G6F38_009817 [Rhizopus arrhizus]KAG1156796.1 hypothetical protein G6F37_007279 [Rhizopus arrhizus]
MPMMRVKYELDPGVIEIDEKPKIYLQELSNFENSEKEKNVKGLRHKSEAEKGSDAPIQPKIEVFSNAHASKADLKKRNTYCKYSTNQIDRFLLLVTEQAPLPSTIMFKWIPSEKQQYSHGCQMKSMYFEKNYVFLDEAGFISTSAVLKVGLKKVNLTNLSFLPLEELRLQSLRLFMHRE